MGGRISWLIVAAASIAADRLFAEEPNAEPVPQTGVNLTPSEKYDRDAPQRMPADRSPALLYFAPDVQYFPAGPTARIILATNADAPSPAKTSAAAVPPPAVAVKAAATPASPPAPLSKQRRQRRAKWSEALQAPANLSIDGGETFTLGGLLERVQKQHGLPVRIDLPHVLPMTSMAEMTTARLAPQRSSNPAVRMPSPLGFAPIGLIQTYSSDVPPTYSGAVTLPPASAPYYSAEPPSVPATFAPAAVVPYAPTTPLSPPVRTDKPVAPPVIPDGNEPVPPVSAIQAEIIPESADGKPTLKAPPAIKEGTPDDSDEKTEPHEAARAVQAMLAEMLSTPVDVTVIQQPEATVEDVLRQAFDRSFPLQALINTSLSEEMPMLASLSKATEWELLLQDDGVLLTTKLNANLHKETRVYSTRELEKAAGLKAEDVARVLTRTVRPWSWKKNFPNAVTDAKPATETKRATKTSKAVSIPKIDLSLLSLLFSSRSTLPKHIRLANDEHAAVPTADSTSESENVELTEEQLELLGRAWEGLFQGAVASLQVVYHADPPTGVIEVLPGMLIVSQSQGAHREIADLLEQLANPEN